MLPTHMLLRPWAHGPMGVVTVVRITDRVPQITDWVLRITDCIENNQSVICNGGTNHGSGGAHGPMGPWAHGPMGPWAHGPKGPRAHGPNTWFLSSSFQVPMGPWGSSGGHPGAAILGSAMENFLLKMGRPSPTAAIPNGGHPGAAMLG